MSLTDAPPIQEDHAPISTPSPGFVPPDPKNYASSPDVAARARKHVLMAYDRAKSVRGNRRELWKEQYLAYRAIRMRKSYKGRANIVDPEPSRAIETINADLEDALLTREAWVRGLPGVGEIMADRKQAEILEGMIHYQLDVGSDGKSLLQSFTKSLCIYGTSIVRAFWDVESRVLPRMRGRKMFPELTEVYRGPRLRMVDIEDFYPSRIIGAEGVKDQDFVIERRDVPYRELYAMEQQGLLANVKKLKEKAKRGTSARTVSDDRRGLDGYGAERMLATHELLMFEGAFDLDDDGIEEDCWIWLGDQGEVLRVIENPYFHRKKTYISTHCIRVPGEFYGISVLEWILDLWAELCDKHNQGLDSATLALNPMWKVGATAGIDKSRILMRPGGTIECHGDSSQLEAIALPDLSSVAYNAMGVLQTQMREASGATTLLQGESHGGIDKATIYQGMIQRATIRQRHILRNIDSMGLAPIAYHFWALNQQFIDTDTLVRVVGRDGFKMVPVRPEDLQYPMDWQGRGTVNLGDLTARGMAYQQVLSTATPLILQGALKMNLEEPFKEWLYGLGLTGVERMFTPPGGETMDPEHENLMMVQHQAVDALQQDDHDAHLRAHAPLRGHRDATVQRINEEHLQAHLQWKQQIAAAQQQMAAFQAAQMMQGLEGPPGRGGGGNGGVQQAQVPGNQQQFGPNVGGAKELGEKFGGRLG